MWQTWILKWRWSLVISLLAALNGCHSYKALFVFPLPTKSHFTTSIVLAEEMARRGHDVTVVSPFPKQKPNYREVIIEPEVYKIESSNGLNLTQLRNTNRFVSATFLWFFFNGWIENAIKSKEIQTIIKSTEQYDVVLGEVSFFQQIIAAIGYKFNAPVIDISPATPFPFTLSIMGNPHTFSYIPNSQTPLNDLMTFYERFYNTMLSMWYILGEYIYLLPAQDAIMRKYFTYPGAENLPPLKEMMKNISLTLVNTHFSINYPRPYSPNMVEVAGYHLKPVKKLPQDLQKFMDEAKNGVIYFSLGSVIKAGALSEERIHTLISALKRLKQQVIFKWEDPAPFKDAKNILVVSWAPQQEILAHPNCVLFVTHGGYSSLIEVTRAGIPILGFPFFGDQPRNVRFYEDRGIGKGIDIENFTNDSLYDSITTIINTPSFRENAAEISRRMQDRPMTPLDTAIFWIEYVIRHKGAHHLKPAAVHLSYYQYILLDVIGLLFLVIFIFYKLICTFCCSKSRSQFTKKENLKKKKN